MQSSKSKLTTSARKGCLFRFHLISTATGKNLCHDSDLITTKDFLSKMLLKIIINSVIHNLITLAKICPKFQVCSPHFSYVDELLCEHWAKIVPRENILTPMYVLCYKCLHERFEVKKSGVSWYWIQAIQQWQSSKPKFSSRQLGAWALEKSLMRPSFFLYFWEIRSVSFEALQ